MTVPRTHADLRTLAPLLEESRDLLGFTIQGEGFRG